MANRTSGIRAFFTRLRRRFDALPAVVREWVKRIWRVIIIVVPAYFVVGLVLLLPVYYFGNTSWPVLTLERAYPYPAMVINGTTISLARYRLEVGARQTYAKGHDLSSSEKETEDFVINQLTSRTLFSQELARNKIVISDGDVNQKYDEIVSQVGGQDTLTAFLHQNYGTNVTAADFRTWIRDSLVEPAVKQQLLVHATVRHILISVPENADQKTIDAARQRAVDIKGKITSVDKFGDVAKQYSEDIASRDKVGLRGVTNHSDDVPAGQVDFENAIFSLPVGQVSDPIRSNFGWHIVLVEAREGSIDLSAKALLEKLKAEGSVRVFVKSH